MGPRGPKGRRGLDGIDGVPVNIRSKNCQFLTGRCIDMIKFCAGSGRYKG